MSTVRAYRAETTVEPSTVKVRAYRAEANVLAQASVQLFRAEVTAPGNADPGPDVINLEAWHEVKMTATAPGSPTSYTWDQVSGPAVNLVLSGTGNVNATYQTPPLLSNTVLTFRVVANYADGTKSGEGVTNHHIVRCPIRFAKADGTYAVVRFTTVP